MTGSIAGTSTVNRLVLHSNIQSTQRLPSDCFLEEKRNKQINFNIQKHSSDLHACNQSRAIAENRQSISIAVDYKCTKHDIDSNHLHLIICQRENFSLFAWRAMSDKIENTNKRLNQTGKTSAYFFFIFSSLLRLFSSLILMK